MSVALIFSFNKILEMFVWSPEKVPIYVLLYRELTETREMIYVRRAVSEGDADDI